MRLGLIIIALAGIAVGLVHIRRVEMTARHEIQDQQTRQTNLRRRLWDQQTRLGVLTSPDEVRRRAAEMCLDLRQREESKSSKSENVKPSGGW